MTMILKMLVNNEDEKKNSTLLINGNFPILTLNLLTWRIW